MSGTGRIEILLDVVKTYNYCFIILWNISFHTPLHESSEAFTIAQIRIYTVEPHGFSRAKTSHTQVTIKAVSNTVMYYSFEI